MTRFAAMISLLFVGNSATSHHGPNSSSDLYLADNLVELNGRIVEVLWRNPHPRLRLDVVDDAGESAVWELEMSGSVISLRAQGIAADLFVLGSNVRAAGVVSRLDPRSLGLLHLLLPNGQEFSTPGRELRWASTRLAATPPEVDARLVEEAEETAVGIFRLWSPSREGEISPTEYGDLLTERGRQLLARYDRLNDDPELDCRQGMPSTMFDPAPMEIRDEGERIVIHVYEFDVERIIHMNSPDSPRGLEPSPLGYSTGHWDGQVLVVTTTAVDWPLLNYTGTPQSDQVRFAERFETSETGEILHFSLTVEDPLMFTEPFTVRRDRTWWPQARMEPFDCVSRWADQSSDELR